MKKPIRNFNRGDKVASSVEKHVASILARGYSEGELAKVSLSGAVASGGLSFVRLYYYTAAKGDRERIARALENATPKIRRELAAAMNQKFTPDIKFEYDDTLERANNIEKLLSSVIPGDVPAVALAEEEDPGPHPQKKKK
ncbi:MAG: 30S ribosome-binding factor RbfA [Rickettsiales bacterium]|jgi:ribosome-binding factor A|nr:30S ribosome-binding factor RbfA [Rickettsiales bacterium]